jgi:hypothetical protein
MLGEVGRGARGRDSEGSPFNEYLAKFRAHVLLYISHDCFIGGFFFSCYPIVVNKLSSLYYISLIFNNQGLRRGNIYYNGILA